MNDDDAWVGVIVLSHPPLERNQRPHLEVVVVVEDDGGGGGGGR